ncbi:MAG: spermidine/putrescine ABC transporter substrate-binding protein [Bryobacteraceae bacterium]|nr:spermidine/putrescine ABC transporter substrate-binding protein [Bryobacteraceae bacterium]
MNRRAFLLGSSGLAACRRDRRPRLNVLNWSDYVADETIPDFVTEFGVRVRYATYESAEEMLAKVLSGNSGWDVVFPPNYFIQPMRENELLAPLDHALLPNLDHLEGEFRHPPWDPELSWSAPYMWGATGIAFNRSLQPAPDTWASLWAPRTAGRITMLDDPAEVIGASLKKLGLSVNATDARELDLARREALRQKPLVRAYLNAEVRDQLVAGDVLAAQLWATTAQQAIAGADDLAFVFPREGFPRYCDNAVILRESDRRDLAHSFLNYLLRPEVAAAVVTATQTATANAAAQHALDAEVRDNPALYPPPEILEKAEWFLPLPAGAQRLRDRIWTEIKAA